MKPKLDEFGNVIKDEGGLIQWEYEPYREPTKWEKRRESFFHYLNKTLYFLTMIIILPIILLATLSAFIQPILEFFGH